MWPFKFRCVELAGGWGVVNSTQGGPAKDKQTDNQMDDITKWEVESPLASTSFISILSDSDSEWTQMTLFTLASDPILWWSLFAISTLELVSSIVFGTNVISRFLPFPRVAWSHKKTNEWDSVFVYYQNTSKNLFYKRRIKICWFVQLLSKGLDIQWKQNGGLTLRSNEW